MPELELELELELGEDALGLARETVARAFAHPDPLGLRSVGIVLESVSGGHGPRLPATGLIAV
ncbi:hypothetical protein [Streptomyces sp. WMMC940]|uniref:hypothetical protein n=1 Tax=Streptomyces sp. WMMC940 TaxID=3015153 RepID=UPI0022B748FE|nr:hypothetical protein [Streptomyces sp. WMMC940]MCZ7462261.1 hypothetical protein [Streptomyces sp. WMMC940]